jgi:hypothetical protein
MVVRSQDRGGRTARLCCWFLTGIALWAPLQLLAERSQPDRSAVLVSLAGSHDGTLEVEGSFVTTAPRSVAWSVLTDYDHIERFVASMKTSKVVGRSEGCPLVEQISVGRLLFVEHTFKVVLRVCEEPSQTIRFVDTWHHSFDLYEGAWSLRDDGKGLAVTYHLQARGGFATGRLTRGASQETVRQLLEQVRAEIQARSH